LKIGDIAGFPEIGEIGDKIENRGENRNIGEKSGTLQVSQEQTCNVPDCAGVGHAQRHDIGDGHAMFVLG
jgi:hypothetical protein